MLLMILLFYVVFIDEMKTHQKSHQPKVINKVIELLLRFPSVSIDFVATDVCKQVYIEAATC